MKLSIRKAGPEADPILRALFARYLDVMAEWFEFEAATAYDDAHIWATGNHVYLASLDGTPIGFALTGPAPKWAAVLEVHEFFVLPEFHRQGAGQQLAAFVWSQHPGDWLVRVLTANTGAVAFWESAISRSSGGTFRADDQQVDGRTWRFFRFYAS